ncbi:conjugal transfer nickase/helicase domain-containing protein [Legionella septentrionalis]|uniref:conjugal transfer nickase/helicase domain-containing protein n=1 Tax=Legionella septentrionalis TaxID=2498109 RepID=UPI000F8DAD26|nr:TraI domain-containing protein [Legionella septentrionalis]RUR09564.1 helicase [Legionella septentrionalis]
MFHRPNKKTISSHAKPLKDLTAVVAPAQLLADEKRQELLTKIKEFSSFDHARFDQLCLSLIHNLINHSQSLPETAHNYYTGPCGLLDHALNRTEAALELFREFVLPEGADLSDPQKLWLYALFSAGILQGIGKLQIDYRVDLFDVNGQLLKEWNPLLESLAAVGTYYHYEFQPEQEEALRRRLNLLLGRLLMPASGFAWIASNPQVLAVWLALLNEDWQGAGTLGAILIRAEAISIQRFFNKLMLKLMGGRSGGRLNRVTTFVDSSPEAISQKEQLAGMEFLRWLTNQLENGKIMVNKAPLFMVPGGMLMCPEIFQWFVQANPEYKTWQLVQNGFLALGLHAKDADGNVMSRFEQANTQQMLSGVVVSKYMVALPDKVKFYNVHTGQESTLTAAELAMSARHVAITARQSGVISSQLSQLSAGGQWQKIEQSGASPHRGTKYSG